MKTCTKCQQEKPTTAFYKKKDGLEASCKECRGRYCADRYQQNKERYRESHRAWVARNPERMKELNNRFYEKNPSYRNSYQRSRLEKDLNFKLGKVLRSRLNSALKNNQKTGSAVKDLGCTVPQFRDYLESKWQPGMTWENWSLHGWHIDHIIPLASFDLTDREQLLKACHYTNLKPMWAKDNRVKKNKCESSSK